MYRLSALLPVADAHTECIIHHSCYREEPCQLDKSWTPEQWDELEQRISDYARKQDERKQETDHPSPGPGQTVIPPPPVVVSTPAVADLGMAEFIKSAISEALAGISQRMSALARKEDKEEKTPYDSGDSSASDTNSCSSSRSPEKKRGSRSKRHPETQET